jgi:hypothetical protein
MTPDTRVSQAGIRFNRDMENLPWGFSFMDFVATPAEAAAPFPCGSEFGREFSPI